MFYKGVVRGVATNYGCMMTHWSIGLTNNCSKILHYHWDVFIIACKQGASTKKLWTIFKNEKVGTLYVLNRI